jgi:hypothetical protein
MDIFARGVYGTMYGVHKTTVYLPEELRRALRQAARAQGRSEAALIREGVRLVTSKPRDPMPTVPLFNSGDPTLAERFDELLEGFGED